MAEDRLIKRIGMWGVFSIASGAMISSGLFVLPGLAFAKAGPAVILAYAIAGILIVPAMLAQAELATAMPRAGGTYFFIERSLGPLAGTIGGLLNWFSVALKSAFAMVGIGAAVALLLPDLTPAGQVWVIKGIAAAGCIVFLMINLFGVHQTVRFQNILVIFLILAVLAYIAGGIRQVDITRFAGFTQQGYRSIMLVAGMVFISYGGLTKVASVAEEIRSPGKTLPMGMIWAFVAVELLYVGAIWVTVGIVPPDQLGQSFAPLALGAKGSMGMVGVWIIEFAAMAAFVTTANAGLLAASRSPLAMSRDGLLPAWLGRTRGKHTVPVNALVVTAAAMVALILFLDIESLVKTASTMMILMFIFVNAALIIMRSSNFQSYRPTFRMPGYPILPIAAIVIYGFLIVDMGYVPLLLTLGFALAACVWYLAYLQKRVHREGALAHLLKQTFAPDQRRTNIEDELVQMALERDESDMDRFDRLVNGCAVIDLPDRMEAAAFFNHAAEVLSDAAGLDCDELYALFLQRERESSTVIEPGLAIPHVIIPGEDCFVMAMVRAKQGIYFDPLHEPVRIAFILLGTKDQRQFHLKALMNIAHVVQEPEFRSRWLDCPGGDQLRDLVILSRRNRRP